MLPSTTALITIFFFFLLSHSHLLSCSQSTHPHNRRILHQPLFPIPTSSPSSPPFQSSPSPSTTTTAQSPTSPSSVPKYPSSTNPIPFFPSFQSPPPPQTTGSSDTPSSPTTSSQPTFPANISSLIFPTTSTRPATPATHSSSHSKLIPAIVAPIVCVVVVALAAFAFLHHRRQARRTRAEAARSDVHRLFPANSTTSDGRKVSASSAAHSADFLYLGTVVNSRGPGVPDPSAAAAAAAGSTPLGAGSPYRKLGSPELHPLPPLSRQSKHNFVNAEAGCCSSDDEFYSPRGSSADKDGSLLGRQGSGSHRSFHVVPQPQSPVLDKCRSGSSNLSSPSYPSSNSASSPTPSSPSPASPQASFSSDGKSSGKSLGTRSGNAVVVDGVEMYPPPPPPPPFRPLCPLTPSPPKRRLPSPSPPASPPQKEDLDTRTAFTPVLPPQTLENHNGVPTTVGGDYNKNPFVTAPRAHTPAPPPPPPPPPPARYWEYRTQQQQQTLPTNPPALVTPKPIGVKTTASSAAVYPADSPRTSEESIDKANDGTPRPKLKPLHWDKVRASSDRVMVWDQLKCSSFQLNEEMIETLFVCNSTTTTPKLTGARQVLPSPNQENRVLDPKKSQNIAILLRALNVTKEEVCEALLEGNTDSLGTELLETLLKMAPSKEEEIKLQDYKDDSPFKLGPAEKFLKAVLDIPFAFKRVEAMLYIANFDSEVNYLTKSFETLEAACEELRSNRMFLKLLEAVLKTGNRMNVGTNRGDAHAFKLDTLLKLVDVKGTDGKTTLLHFVVQEIIRAEGSRLSSGNQNLSNGKTQSNTARDEHELKKLGLQVVSGLSGELSNVKKAATMDAEVLGNYVSKLAGGVKKIGEVLRLNTVQCPQENGQKFQEAMGGFLKRAEDEILKVQAQESVALSLVKEITEYFHGNSTREEAHPFRIFLVVKEFLSTLDQVCKEVGKINERIYISSARNLPVPVNPTSAPVFPRLHNQRASGSSEEDEDSSASS